MSRGRAGRFVAILGSSCVAAVWLNACTDTQSSEDANDAAGEQANACQAPSEVEEGAGRIPTVEVSPSGLLSSGTAVCISGSGFSDGGDVWAELCGYDEQERDLGCLWLEQSPVSADGTFAIDEILWAEFAGDFTPDGIDADTNVDCTVDRCEVRVDSNVAVAGEPPQVPVSFTARQSRARPALELEPPAPATTRPRLSGSGFFPGAQIQIQLCSSGRCEDLANKLADADGYFSTAVVTPVGASCGADGDCFITAHVTTSERRDRPPALNPKPVALVSP